MIHTEAEARAFCAARAYAKSDTLERFVSLLRVENDRQNLVARNSLEEVWTRHMADSLQLLDHVPRGTGTWLDLGSGGGFPGLVVAMSCPEQSFVLVEPRKLRVEWLRSVTDGLGLTNVSVVGSRLESVLTFQAAVISARAFAPLPKLLRLSARFSTSSTCWALPKGRSSGQELQEQSPAIRRMFHVEQSVTDPSAGILIGRGVPDLR